MISEFYVNLGGYFVYNLYDNCPVQLFKRKRSQPKWPYPPFPGNLPSLGHLTCT